MIVQVGALLAVPMGPLLSTWSLWNHGSREELTMVIDGTADGDCSHQIKRHLLLGRKAVTNLDSILKSKAMVFKNPLDFKEIKPVNPKGNQEYSGLNIHWKD